MAKRRTPATRRTLDARPDSLDFRDRMFVPTLVEVPVRIPLERYREWKVPILDQGQEGACTGFGLATVANYLLRRRVVVPEDVCVSPRMLYEMAKRYDEWPGENYDGSSARGAMKGWNKHGVCAEQQWPYDAKKKLRPTANSWTDAARRPLGAYYRVNHKDLVAMHSAIAEVGALYATSSVHEGWNDVGADGIIPLTDRMTGGHAFAIVAYDERGFWIQNSWADDWGFHGFGLVSYDDWLVHGTDIWVARLGAPVVLHTPSATAVGMTTAARGSRGYAYPDLRAHIISIGNDGQLRTDGTYGTSAADVAQIFEEDLPRITSGWSKKRVLLYAHGGLVAEDEAIQKLADYRAAMLEAEVYPISIIWKTDYLTTLRNMLQDALRRRRPEGVLDASKDFMLDRLDDALEPLARALTGKLAWDEMKNNALLASTSASGGARILAAHLADLIEADASIELHVAGHSAGGILLAPLVQLLTGGHIEAGPMRGKSGHELEVATCTLWAPSCTIELFKETYVPAFAGGRLRRFALFTLTDETERADDCAGIYHKSLLYLISDAFEALPRIPLFREGVPLLGLERWVAADRELTAFFRSARATWVKAPNAEPAGSESASRARHHIDFDSDRATLEATLARILREDADGRRRFTMHRSGEAPARLRAALSEAQRAQ